MRRRRHPPQDEEDPARQTRTRFQEDIAGQARSEDGSVEEKWSAIKIFSDRVSRVSTQYRDDITQTGSLRVLLALSPCSSAETTCMPSGWPLEDLQTCRDIGRSMVMPAELFVKQRTVGSKLLKRRFGEKKVWRCIRALQSGRRGLRPTRCTSIRDEEGNLCDSQSAKYQR